MTRTAFKDQPFAHRVGAMGDAAERIFEQVYSQGWARFGLCRPPIDVGALPLKMRYAPDYITSKGLVECQGLGADRTFKLKLEKKRALELWHADFRVDFFVYDSRKRRYGFMRWHELDEAIAAHGALSWFREGKAYHAVHVDDLPVIEWLPAPRARKEAA